MHAARRKATIWQYRLGGDRAPWGCVRFIRTVRPVRRPRAPQSATATPSAMAAGGFRADVEAMLEARDTIHPDGWFGMDRAEWIAAADEVAARAETLSDDQRLVELVRLAAMPTWNGRDGHSGIWPFTPDDGTHLYPVRWWRFPEGLVITAARAPYEDLVGARVEAIGGRPIDEVLGLVEPLAPRDNPSNLLAFSTLFLRVSELLAGLGVIDEAGPTPFTVVGRDGVRRDVTIEPVTPAIEDAWDSGLPHRLAPTDAPWLRDQDETLWWTFLEDSGTLFAQFNAVRGDATDVISEIRERAQADDVERVVIDLRHNSGGDNTTLAPLELALRDPAIDRPGQAVRDHRPGDVLRCGELRDRSRGGHLGHVRRRGHGREPEPVRRHASRDAARQRPDPADGGPLLGAQHARRHADHDRTGDPRRADGGRLLRRARSGARGDRRRVVEFGLTSCPG